MTSGTSTKKPVTNLPAKPRHHPRTHPAPMAARSATPSAMRYHANGAHPDRADKREERPDDEQRREERHDEADGNLERRVPATAVPRYRAGRARMPLTWSGSPRRMKIPRPPCGSGRHAMPPMIVAPERETPGTSARLWHTPTANARGSGVSSASLDDRRRPPPLEQQHHDAAGDERDGPHARALIEDALDETCEERAGDERGNGRDHDRRREMPRLRPASRGPRSC